jgi:futalosine hydrolase
MFQFRDYALPMRLVIVTAVDAEARAIGDLAAEGVMIVVSGIGRTNAAAATTEAILKQWKTGGVDAVISAGVAGSLPGGGLGIGDVLVASSCIYVEEGLISPTGFTDMRSMGFALGDFEGNAVPVDEQLLDTFSTHFPIGPIATVATCSGTDAAAAEVVRRTGALAEAMEGAAVVHAARRLRVPAIEIRAISNTTGDRKNQLWDLQAGLKALGEAVVKVQFGI